MVKVYISDVVVVHVNISVIVDVVFIEDYANVIENVKLSYLVKPDYFYVYVD